MKTLTPHEQFYSADYVFEVLIVNRQTNESCMVGYCTNDANLDRVLKEVNLYLKDYPNFYCQIRNKIANEINDIYMERVEDFVKYSFNWQTQ